MVVVIQDLWLVPLATTTGQTIRNGETTSVAMATAVKKKATAIEADPPLSMFASDMWTLPKNTSAPSRANSQCVIILNYIHCWAVIRFVLQTRVCASLHHGSGSGDGCNDGARRICPRDTACNPDWSQLMARQVSPCSHVFVMTHCNAVTSWWRQARRMRYAVNGACIPQIADCLRYFRLQNVQSSMEKWLFQA